MLQKEKQNGYQGSVLESDCNIQWSYERRLVLMVFRSELFFAKNTCYASVFSLLTGQKISGYIQKYEKCKHRFWFVKLNAWMYPTKSWGYYVHQNYLFFDKCEPAFGIHNTFQENHILTDLLFTPKRIFLCLIFQLFSLLTLKQNILTQEETRYSFSMEGGFSFQGQQLHVFKFNYHEIVDQSFRLHVCVSDLPRAQCH